MKIMRGLEFHGQAGRGQRRVGVDDGIDQPFMRPRVVAPAAHALQAQAVRQAVGLERLVVESCAVESLAESERELGSIGDRGVGSAQPHALFIEQRIRRRRRRRETR